MQHLKPRVAGLAPALSRNKTFAVLARPAFAGPTPESVRDAKIIRKLRPGVCAHLMSLSREARAESAKVYAFQFYEHLLPFTRPSQAFQDLVAEALMAQCWGEQMGRKIATPTGPAVESGEDPGRRPAGSAAVILNDPSRGRLACVRIDIAPYRDKAIELIQRNQIRFNCPEVNSKGAGAEEFVRQQLARTLGAIDQRVTTALMNMKPSASGEDRTGLLFPVNQGYADGLERIRSIFEAMVQQILADCRLPANNKAMAVPVSRAIIATPARAAYPVPVIEGAVATRAPALNEQELNAYGRLLLDQMRSTPRYAEACTRVGQVKPGFANERALTEVDQYLLDLDPELLEIVRGTRQWVTNENANAFNFRIGNTNAGTTGRDPVERRTWLLNVRDRAARQLTAACGRNPMPLVTFVPPQGGRKAPGPSQKRPAGVPVALSRVGRVQGWNHGYGTSVRILEGIQDQDPQLCERLQREPSEQRRTQVALERINQWILPMRRPMPPVSNLDPRWTYSAYALPFEYPAIFRQSGLFVMRDDDFASDRLIAARTLAQACAAPSASTSVKPVAVRGEAVSSGEENSGVKRRPRFAR